MTKGIDRDGYDMPRISMKIPARAENVAVVRHTLGELATSMRLENGVLTNMKVAVSEACANVVLHAYDGDGEMELEIMRGDAAVTVVVRDDGAGFRPRVHSPEHPSWRLGMPLIASVSDALEVGHGPEGRGTEVRMRFAA